MIIGLALDGIFILIRSIYRTIVSSFMSFVAIIVVYLLFQLLGIDGRMGWPDHYYSSLLQWAPSLLL